MSSFSERVYMYKKVIAKKKINHTIAIFQKL